MVLQLLNKKQRFLELIPGLTLHFLVVWQGRRSRNNSLSLAAQKEREIQPEILSAEWNTKA